MRPNWPYIGPEQGVFKSFAYLTGRHRAWATAHLEEALTCANTGRLHCISRVTGPERDQTNRPLHPLMYQARGSSTSPEARQSGSTSLTDRQNHPLRSRGVVRGERLPGRVVAAVPADVPRSSAGALWCCRMLSKFIEVS